MSEDLRTEKEILHQMEDSIDRINFYLWGKLEGKNINSPYGETTLRGRIGNNVEMLMDKKLSDMASTYKKLKKEYVEENNTMTYGEFLIYLGIILSVLGGLLAWTLLA